TCKASLIQKVVKHRNSRKFAQADENKGKINFVNLALELCSAGYSQNCKVKKKNGATLIAFAPFRFGGNELDSGKNERPGRKSHAGSACVDRARAAKDCRPLCQESD